MYADSNPFSVNKMKKMDLYRNRQRIRIREKRTGYGKKSLRHENPSSQVGSWNDRVSHDRFQRCQEMSARIP